MKKMIMIASLMLSMNCMLGCAGNSVDDSANEITQEETPEWNSVEERELQYGQIANLGRGYLVYAVSDQPDIDYKLYYVEADDKGDSVTDEDFKIEEATYVFPDVREGNVAIGKFVEIYFVDIAPLISEEKTILLAVATYEKDGKEYYDTRVYDINENDISVNDGLTQELNEKYSDVEDYPVEEIIQMPHD